MNKYICLLVILFLSGCVSQEPSENAILTAIAKTQIAQQLANPQPGLQTGQDIPAITETTPTIGAGQLEATPSPTVSDVTQPADTLDPEIYPEVDTGLRLTRITGQRNGWNTYQSFLVFRNNFATSIHLLLGGRKTPIWILAFTPSLSVLSVDASESYVMTEEGKTYPVQVSYLSNKYRYDWFGGVILPTGLWAMDMNHDRDTFSPFVLLSYEVPELLHPSSLVISPGLSYEQSGAIPVTLEHSASYNGLLMPSPTSAVDRIPASLKLDDFIEMTISSYEITSEDELLVDFKFTNTDITDDRPANVAIFLTLLDGGIYRPAVGCTVGSISPVLGPNQTESSRLCFILKGRNHYEGQQFYMTVIGEHVERTFQLSK